jgi:hypothetical protein
MRAKADISLFQNHSQITREGRALLERHRKGDLKRNAVALDVENPRSINLEKGGVMGSVAQSGARR